MPDALHHSSWAALLNVSHDGRQLGILLQLLQFRLDVVSELRVLHALHHLHHRWVLLHITKDGSMSVACQRHNFAC